MSQAILENEGTLATKEQKVCEVQLASLDKEDHKESMRWCPTLLIAYGEVGVSLLSARGLAGKLGSAGSELSKCTQKMLRSNAEESRKSM